MFWMNILKEICMRTVPEYAKNFLFYIKIFWKFYFKLYKNWIDILFCIFTISSSFILHSWLSNCLVYELFAIEISKKHFKYCLNIKCQLSIGQTLGLLLCKWNMKTAWRQYFCISKSSPALWTQIQISEFVYLCK